MKELNREYAMSNADLMMLASKFVFNMTRDAAEFAARGVDAAAITAFETLGNAFEVFPPDEVYIGELKDATSAKNVLRDTITDELQLISGFFEQKWGADSGKYTSLRVKGFHNFSDPSFLLTARTVVAQAIAYLADLTPIGLTQAMIDSLTANAQSFEDALIDIVDKKEVRDTKANERTEKGNELYEFAALYAKIGKLIWENVDEAKYNDYIIYPAEHPGLSKPQNLTANWDSGTPDVIELNWDAVTGATNYDIFYDIAETGAPAGDFEFLNNFPSPPVVVPSTYNKRNYFKIKAKNETQTSPYSDEAFVDVPEEPTG